MESQKLPIIYNLVAALIGAFGQLAYKKGSEKLGQVPLYSNYMIFLGVLLFCVVMLLFVMAYKAGGRISVVYPFYATTFFWGAIIGFIFEKEPFRWGLVWGTLSIFVGLLIIARTVEA